MTSMQPRTIATRRGRMQVADIGEGPPVIIVHGMPGDWSQAAPLARELADEHRVLLVSRPGYGQTPLATGPTWEQSADAYAAMLDTLGLERAAMIGISGGGPSSHAFASRHRDRCAGLVLACALHPDAMPVPIALRVLYALPVVREVLTRWANRREVTALQDIDGVVERTLAQAADAERAEVEADPIAMEHLVEFLHHHARVTRDSRPFRHDLALLVAHQRAGAPLAWLPGPDVPTLVLHGDADEVVPLACAERYHLDIPGSRLEVFADAGHAFLFTFRQRSNELLRDFLSAAADRGA